MWCHLNSHSNVLCLLFPLLDIFLKGLNKKKSCSVDAPLLLMMDFVSHGEQPSPSRAT